MVIGRHVRFSQRTGKFHSVQFWRRVKLCKEWGWQVHAIRMMKLLGGGGVLILRF